MIDTFDVRKELAEYRAPDESWDMAEVTSEEYMDAMSSSPYSNLPTAPFATATKLPDYGYPECQTAAHWIDDCRAERFDEHDPARVVPEHGSELDNW